MQMINIYILNIKENFNKKFKFSTIMSIAKTNIQITVTEDAILELIRLFIEFIIKYYQNIGLNIKKIYYKS